MRLFFRGWLWRRPWLRAACVVTAAAGGCAATPGVEQTEVEAYRQFNEQLALSTQAINAGDLEEAKGYLKGASAAATRPAQQEKVRSLDRLITGAEALRGGDAERARSEWSRIEETDLAREVRHKARLIGLDVPMVPTGGEATQ